MAFFGWKGKEEMTDDPKSSFDWSKVVNLLTDMENKGFYGSLELKFENGRPVYAKIIEGVRL